MKTTLVTLACIICLAAQAAQHEILMKSISYEPKRIEIKLGDTLLFKNVSYTPHSATAEDKSFDTGMIDPKKKAEPIKLEKVGSYTYHCHMHGKSMTGQVVVTP